jgi:N-methylhydantoinase A
MALDLPACERAMTTLAQKLGLEAVGTADGILRIAVTAMSYAVKAVTTERGLDAGAFTMVVYGGAGPLHASAIAREIGIRRVLIPYSPGHFSAFGMLFSDLRYDYVRSCFRRLDDVSFDELEEIYRAMEDEGRAALARSSVQPDAVVVERAADMRYVGQEHAVTVELGAAVFSTRDKAALKRRFDEVHAVRYGTSAPNEPGDIVSLRTTVLGVMRKPAPRAVDTGEETPPTDAVRIRKPVYFGDRFHDTPVYARTQLRAGNRIAGPALVEEHASTTVLQPGDDLVVDGFGNLNLSIGARA